MMSEAQREQTRADHKQLTEYTSGRAEGLSPRAAALQAGFTPDQASNAPRRIEPKAQSAIRDYLAKHGATNEDVAAAIGRGLVSRKRSKSGDLDPDTPSQLAAARFVAELRGELKQATGDNTMTITLSGPMVETFLKARAEAVVPADDYIEGE